MTHDEINIAIAEACGLFKIEPLRRTTRKGKLDPNGVVLWYCEEHHGGAATYARIPNYCHDLNAMHEAEKLLETADQQNRYYAEIANITWCNLETGNRQVVFNQLTATAHQRAEAFLRTLNLWTE